MVMSRKTSSRSAAKNANNVQKMSRRPATAEKRAVKPSRTLSSVPPVVGKGSLTMSQVRHAVAQALHGKTFEADA